MTNAVLKMPLQSSVSLQKSKTDPASHQPKPDSMGRNYQTHVTSRSRERGVILTLPGWKKLQTAKSLAEFKENAGDRFTLEELSERTELSLRTISKALGRLEPVDKYSLQTMFQSFGLELSKNDYTRPASRSEALETQQSNSRQDWNSGISGIDRSLLATHSISSVCFSPDGKTLANSSSDFSVHLWDVESGQCFNVLQGHASWIYSVCFSPDGLTLASGSQDGTVKLWNVRTGECLRTLRLCSKSVESC